MNGYSSLDGWTDDELTGYLSRPDHPDWLRTADGRWWSRSDVERARDAVEDADPAGGIEARMRFVERLRQRAGR